MDTSSWLGFTLLIIGLIVDGIVGLVALVVWFRMRADRNTRRQIEKRPRDVETRHDTFIRSRITLEAMEARIDDLERLTEEPWKSSAPESNPSPHSRALLN